MIKLIQVHCIDEISIRQDEHVLAFRITFIAHFQNQESDEEVLEDVLLLETAHQFELREAFFEEFVL